MKKIPATVVVFAAAAVVTVAAAPRFAAPPSALELAHASAAVAQAYAATASAKFDSTRGEGIVPRGANDAMDRAAKYASEAADHYERAKKGQ